MASSRAAAGPFALCILLLASPAVSAAFLFDDGKSAAKGKGKAAVDVEWRPATATWYGDAEGDGSTGKKLSTRLASIVVLEFALLCIAVTLHFRV